MNVAALLVHTALCLTIVWYCFDAIYKMNGATSALVAFAYCCMFWGVTIKMAAVFAPLAKVGGPGVVQGLSMVDIPSWDLVWLAGLAAFHVIESRKWRRGVPCEYQSNWGDLDSEGRP